MSKNTNITAPDKPAVGDGPGHQTVHLELNVHDDFVEFARGAGTSVEALFYNWVIEGLVRDVEMRPAHLRTIDSLVDVPTDYLYEMSPEAGVKEAIGLMQQLMVIIDDIIQDTDKQRATVRVARAWGTLRAIGNAVGDIANSRDNNARDASPKK